MSRSSTARLQAESRRCPQCNRKSALLTITSNPGQVSLICQYGCGYESTTDLHTDA